MNRPYERTSDARPYVLPLSLRGPTGRGNPFPYGWVSICRLGDEYDINPLLPRKAYRVRQHISNAAGIYRKSLVGFISIHYAESVMLIILLLFNKENTEGVSAAVSGNCTARTGEKDLLENAKGLNLVNALHINILIAACVGNKYTVKIYL